jgi:signal transduction histidine kinase
VQATSTLRSWIGGAISLAGLIAIVSSVITGQPRPALGGRGLVILCGVVLVTVSWVVWMARMRLRPALGARHQIGPELFVLATSSGFITMAASSSGGSTAAVAAYVAIISGGIRVGFLKGLPLLTAAIVGVGASTLIYDKPALVWLIYALGLAATMLGGASIHASIVRSEQAELLLAQTQRSHEEELRAAKLQEQARIAREIHDLLAHTLAGLTIQLEATEALLAKGASTESVRERIARAHELARTGLAETRRAVGVLRGDPGPALPTGPVPAAAVLRQLVANYRAANPSARAELSIDGDSEALSTGQSAAILRVAQEALTNVIKHAPGASVRVALRVNDEAVLEISDDGAAQALSELAGSGSGAGVVGMRERAQALGGDLEAGPAGSGWRVLLRLPRTTPVTAPLQD